MFKGTERRDAQGDRARASSRWADTSTRSPAREQVCYYARALSEHLPDVVDVLVDIVCRSRFAPAEVAREKSVGARGDLRVPRTIPRTRSASCCREQVWGDHPLGRPDPRHRRDARPAIAARTCIDVLPAPVPRREPGGRRAPARSSTSRSSSWSQRHFDAAGGEAAAAVRGPPPPFSPSRPPRRARTISSSSTSRSAPARLRVRRRRALPAGRAPHAARRRHELAPVPERARGGGARVLGVSRRPTSTATPACSRSTWACRPSAGARRSTRVRQELETCCALAAPTRRIADAAAQICGGIADGAGERLEPHVPASPARRSICAHTTPGEEQVERGRGGDT